MQLRRFWGRVMVVDVGDGDELQQEIAITTFDNREKVFEDDYLADTLAALPSAHQHLTVNTV